MVPQDLALANNSTCSSSPRSSSNNNTNFLASKGLPHPAGEGLLSWQAPLSPRLWGWVCTPCTKTLQQCTSTQDGEPRATPMMEQSQGRRKLEAYKEDSSPPNRAGGLCFLTSLRLYSGFWLGGILPAAATTAAGCCGAARRAPELGHRG